MSFMFNPYPYEDTTCINKPRISEEAAGSVVHGNKAGIDMLCRNIDQYFAESPQSSTCLVGLDGYVSADWEQTINLLSQELSGKGIGFQARSVASAYKSTVELDTMLAANLEEDLEMDPVLLFGRLFKEGIENLFDAVKLAQMGKDLQGADKTGRQVIVVYGHGALIQALRGHYQLKLFYDVTPKRAILRIRNGSYVNLGDRKARPYKRMMRRCYYFDFEVTGHHRAKLLQNNEIDYYVASDDPMNLQFVPMEAFSEICTSLVCYPFRCKPVYNEGIWGGHFMTRVRNLPAEMKNCAWIFDLIPLEVSLLIQAGETLLEIPYFTFVQKVGKELMGEDCVRKFSGYFPIRFNYDDTWHSSGNMSIQVHPPKDYAMEHFNELGGQDESYYIVASGHDARTWLGWKEDASVDEFYDKMRQSEKEATPVDYPKYIHAVDSKPGTQVLLPGGTIHSSGRNQVVLEIGSLTVGSYTFKLYDYLRQDLDGKPRPIHSRHGVNVLCRDRKENWVEENLVPVPKVLREGEGWKESIIGAHDLMYFHLRRLEFEREIEDDTEGLFHVLTLVDGEKVRISSIEHPERFYLQKYLDIVVVPANMGRYRITNLGNPPVYVHKTLLKKDFMQY